jgi:hypothetical protein
MLRKPLLLPTRSAKVVSMSMEGSDSAEPLMRAYNGNRERTTSDQEQQEHQGEPVGFGGRAERRSVVINRSRGRQDALGFRARQPRLVPISL